MGYTRKGGFYEPDDYTPYMEAHYDLWDLIQDKDTILTQIIEEDYPELKGLPVCEEIDDDIWMESFADYIDEIHESEFCELDKKRGDDELDVESTYEEYVHMMIHHWKEDNNHD